MEDQELQQTGTPPKPEGLLYHYTDEKGLYGILDSGEIWATHYRFLNDLAEQKEGSALLYSFLDETNLEYTRLYRNEIKMLFDYDLTHMQLFVASFSGDSADAVGGDRLSQWRGYSPNRTGFSLGFDGSLLRAKAESLMVKTVLAVFLWQCVYSKEGKNEIERKITSVFEEKVEMNLNAFSQKWAHFSRENVEMGQLNREKRRQEFREIAFYPLRDEFLRWCATLKHEGFNEEREWRLACYVHEEVTDLKFVQLRDRQYGHTPNIQVPLGLSDSDSPLKRIVVGPSQNHEQAAISLGIELAKRGLKGVKVVPSQIPYRNW
ncbi:MAG: DUF2971 domain-containing protein [Terracidiphilus sp.]